DNIMNFYLKYLQFSSAKLDRNVLDQIFVYDTLFASQLLGNTRKRVKTGLPPHILAFTMDHTFETIYRKQLKRWTKDIDIFSKDYLIIPLIKDNHWFLA